MQIYTGTILKKNILCTDVIELNISYEDAEVIEPGQFMNFQIEGFFLRRPISVAEVGNGYFTIVFKTIGQGTYSLGKLNKGDQVNFLGPLGRSFDIEGDKDNILLIGGGLGLPPLYELAKRYVKLGKNVICAFGFKNREQIFYLDRFEKFACKQYIATEDGSVGFKGNVISMIKSYDLKYDFVYCVGPRPMLKACQENFSRGYISLEERMGCGFGACMGCICKDKNNSDNTYRVCKEGPVFKLGQVDL